MKRYTFTVLLAVTIILPAVWGDEYLIPSVARLEYSLGPGIIDQTKLQSFNSTRERNEFLNGKYSFQIYSNSIEDYFFGMYSRFYLEPEVLEKLTEQRETVLSALSELYTSGARNIYTEKAPLHKIEGSYMKIQDKRFPLCEQYMAVSPTDGGFAPQTYSISRYFVVGDHAIRLSLYYHDYSCSEARKYPDFFEYSSAGLRFKEPVAESTSAFHAAILSEATRPEIIDGLMKHWSSIMEGISIH